MLRRVAVRAMLLCLLCAAAAACNEKGRRQGLELQVPRHQGGLRRPVEVRAGDGGELADSLGNEALFQPRAVRGGSEAHRRVLQGPRLPGRAGDVVRREAERQADLRRASPSTSKKGSRCASSASCSRGSSRCPRRVARRSKPSSRSRRAPRSIARSCRPTASRRSTSSEIHGYPYASVRLSESPGSTERAARHHAAGGARAR